MESSCANPQKVQPEENTLRKSTAAHNINYCELWFFSLWLATTTDLISAAEFSGKVNCLPQPVGGWT